MGPLIVLLVLGFLAFVFFGACSGFWAQSKARRLDVELDILRRDLARLRREAGSSAERAAAKAEPTPSPAAGVAPRPAVPSVVARPPEPEIAPITSPWPAEPAAPPAPEPVPATPTPVSEPSPTPAPEPLLEGAPSFRPAWVDKLVAFFHRPDWVAALEQNVGQRWMTWAGGLAIFAAVGFFIKYAIDQQWVGPGARVASGILAGLAILVAGDRFVRKGMRPLGLGLIGAAGLPILYVSLYGGYHIYGLLPQPVAFGSMILVTAAGIVLAVRHDSLVVSFLSLLGGQLTPVLVSSGQDARAILFSYLLILDLGVLGVAWFRNWRALDVLAFAGTAVLFGSWYGRFYSEAALAPTLAWVGAFYATFLALPVVYHLRRREALPLERFVLALAVATTTLLCAHDMLYGNHRKLLAAVTLVMSASYALLGVAVRRRVPDDRRSVLAFLALSVMFATLAAPLALASNATTLVWAAEGSVLVVLGYLYAYPPLRVGGLVLHVLAVCRLFLLHFPTTAQDVPLLLNARVAIAAFTCAALAVAAVVHHVWRDRATLFDAVAKLSLGLGSGLLALLVLHGEWGRWLVLRAAQGPLPAEYWYLLSGAGVWAAGSVCLLGAGLRARSVLVRRFGVVALLAAFVMGLLLYLHDPPSASAHFANARFFIALALAAAGFAYAALSNRFSERLNAQEWGFGRACGIVAGALVLFALHVELWGALESQGSYTATCCVVLLWVTGWAAFLAAGLGLGSVLVRTAGLGALAVAAVAAASLYGELLPQGAVRFSNLRFWFALLVPLAGLVHARLARLRDVRWPFDEVRLALALCVLAGVGILLVLHAELAPWLATWGPLASRCGVAMLWAAGAGAFMAAGVRRGVLEWRGTALVLLIPATALLWRAFALQTPGLLLLLNGRVLASVVLGGVMLASGRALLNQVEGEQPVGYVLCWAATVVLLAALSADAYYYTVEHVVDPQRARFASQMALSIVWSLYAAGMLAVGFWKRRRPVRFAALGLFAVTTVKLLFVDLAAIRQQQVFRILSFLVAGVLMIAASYLYHRLEKYLERVWQEGEE